MKKNTLVIISVAVSFTAILIVIGWRYTQPREESQYAETRWRTTGVTMVADVHAERMDGRALVGATVSYYQNSGRQEGVTDVFANARIRLSEWDCELIEINGLPVLDKAGHKFIGAPRGDGGLEVNVRLKPPGRALIDRGGLRGRR